MDEWLCVIVCLLSGMVRHPAVEAKGCFYKVVQERSIICLSGIWNNWRKKSLRLHEQRAEGLNNPLNGQMESAQKDQHAARYEDGREPCFWGGPGPG